jgi:hypothetical protein
MEHLHEDIVERDKKKFTDLDPDTFTGPPPGNIVQLKYDGNWVELRIRNEQGIVITSGGVERISFSAEGVPDQDILAEHIVNTNWAKSVPFEGAFLAHTLLSWMGDNLRSEPESNRYLLLDRSVRQLNQLIALDIQRVISYDASKWEELWKKHVVDGIFEGLVFKNSRDSFDHYLKQWRLKKKVTNEYVVMGFVEGKGRLSGTLGAIIGGLYINGKLTDACTVGGGFSDILRDDIWSKREIYIGQVFEAVGKGYFPKSGALRHPAFKCWRPDKPAEKCILLPYQGE